jgi:hypothetical protein
MASDIVEVAFLPWGSCYLSLDVLYLPQSALLRGRGRPDLLVLLPSSADALSSRPLSS